MKLLKNSSLLWYSKAPYRIDQSPQLVTVLNKRTRVVSSRPILISVVTECK